MADFVFSLAQKVLEKLASFAYEEISLAWGLKGEIEKFRETLSTIKAVLLDAEERQTNSEALRNWLRKLKDVLLNARDLLDEIECEVLRSRVVKVHGSVDRKLRRLISSSNPLVFHFSIGHGIKKIRERIDEIAAEKDKFNLIVHHEEKKIKHGRREPTYSYVRASEVIGREGEKKKIVELLMQSDDERNVDVIPICGIGGLGKTTLAKMVYDDGRVKDHFDLKMWVHASKDFIVPRLIKEILDSATGKVNENLTLEMLQTKLRDTLSGVKFLLILDDVWNEIPDKWFELRDLLMVGSKGSKIIVTTRGNFIASLVGTVPAINLTGLSKRDSLSLFLKWAFKDKQHERLVEIGRDIVERCQGVPLAVRTLGSLLYSKVDEQDWIDVRDNEMWKLKQNEDHILPVLRLSYDELPSYLKQCFLYCSLFPKGYKFHISNVIQFWIALGVVLQSHDENKSLEYIGEQHFGELWSRSFFQVDENHFDVAKHGFNNTFIMHDLIHDLSLSVAESECFIVNSQTKDIPKRVGHLSVTDGAKDKVQTFLNSLANVRTIRLVVDDELEMHHEQEPSTACLVDKCITRFKYLRILDLSYSSFEMLPISIGRAKHLRYLDLSDNDEIRKLPDSICKLQSLLTLKLEGCENLEGLPRDMKYLISLRFLSITTNETFIPEDRIACLTSLRTLIISGCENLVSLPDCLRSLTGLEDLRIINCRMLELNEADEVGTLNLQTLRLAFLPKMVALPGWLQRSADTLRYLHIVDCVMLTKLPEWLTKMTSIQKIFICNCRCLESLPEEGMHRLTSLQEIRICKCQKLREFIEEIGENWVQKVNFDPMPQRINSEVRLKNVSWAISQLALKRGNI